MVTTANRLPLPLRALNAAGKLALAIGWQPVTLDAGRLLAKARRATGLSEFGGEDFLPRLERLLSSLETEAQLTTFGRIAVKADLLRVLENRLRLVDLVKRHPEILEQRIDRPLFVVGPPRTGTTIFHDLLAQDPANRVPLSWEVAHPVPPPEAATYRTDPRIKQVQAQLDQVDKLIPEFKKMHPMGAERAQECVAITSHDFASMIFNTQYRVPAYEDWLVEHDMGAALRFHRLFLQVLQWRVPGVRWALKSPQHLWHLRYVLREYPDALVVQTHRDPVRVLVSVSSLIATLRSLASDRVDIRDIACYYARSLASGYAHTITVRREGLLPAEQVVDLYFRDFMRDQVGTVARAYRHFGLDLNDRALTGMKAFLADNPADKHGRHAYTLADTGLSEAEARAMFSDYQSYFSVPAEDVAH